MKVHPIQAHRGPHRAAKTIVVCFRASPRGSAGGKLAGDESEARRAVTGTPDYGAPADFRLYRGEDISADLLEECRTLFNGHYGHWSKSSPRAGKRIQLPSRLMRDYVAGDAGLAALARLRR